MAKTITPVAPEFQINVNSGGNNGISGAQDLANLAVLTDGRFVVTYQSDYFGSATDTDPIVAIFNANGTTSLGYRDAYNAGGHQSAPSVAARLNGGFGVVFQNDRHANNTVDANGPNITYVPVTAAGGVLSPIAVADFNAGAGHDALQNPEIATLSSGRQVVAFERIWTAGTDHDVFLNVVDATGTGTQFSIASPLDVSSNASWQANPSVAAIGNSALVVYEDGTGTTTASANIRGRLFNGDTNTLGAAFTIADHVGRLRTADVAAIDNNRYAITYGDQNDVWVKVLDSTTGIFSAEIQLDVTGGFSLNPQVSGTAGAGFVVTWAQYNGADYDVRARLFDGHANAVGSDFIVTSLTNASQFTPDVTVSGTHVFFAWTDFSARPEDTAAPGIRGRIFSTGSDSDFNGDANSDILWRHSDGQVVEWQMNGDQIAANLAVATPGNEWKFQDTGDFGGDGFSDVMWRHTTGQVVLWQMNGDQIVSNTAIVDVSNQYHVQGIGDFGGDGKSDVLFRHDSGQVVLWQLNGDTIAVNTAIVNVSTQYHIEGVGDFGGDGKSDVLLRHDNGQVVLWQMNGDTIAVNTSIANVSQQYHVQGIGDLNGDGKSDVVWRHDSGQIVLWQMNGATIVANTQILDVSNQYKVQDVRDYNDDGMSDILLRHDNGQVVLWQMNGDHIAANTAITTVGTDWAIQSHHFDLV